jgi:hypothetical protein
MYVCTYVCRVENHQSVFLKLRPFTISKITLPPFLYIYIWRLE